MILLIIKELLLIGLVLKPEQLSLLTETVNKVKSPKNKIYM